eukprot:TRINITY_DN4148_c0_g1_i2.p2 TRINITY_DN4148_c0_g1~~TRINITY_DN4148_c0_g1_i2.p2  ORF type:complete len:135 (+),score=7.87 TRINITY_DN4148_c0_g1_i2:638-1042(+)
MLAAIAVVPIVVSIIFIVLFHRMRGVITALRQDVKRQKFAKKLTIISSIFIVSINTNIGFLGISAGPGFAFSLQPYIIWPLLYLPQLVFIGAVAWFTVKKKSALHLPPWRGMRTHMRSVNRTRSRTHVRTLPRT